MGSFCGKDLGADSVKTLNWILQIVEDLIFFTEFIQIKRANVSCCCKQGNEISSFMKSGNFFS
jgi:hypothetical protein